MSTTPQSSRYPRPLRATHALAAATGGGSSGGGGGSISPLPPGRRPPLSSSVTAATSPSSPGAGSGAARRAGLLPSPDQLGTGERILVPVSGGRGGERDEVEGGGEDRDDGDSRRRANSLSSLADTGCCYGNLLWQRGPQLDLPLAPEGEGVVDESGTTTDQKEQMFHAFSHKRSNSCSSADSLKKTPPLSAGSRRPDNVHSRKSIEGLNQEVSTALEGVLIISPHNPPDGHMAPIRELLHNRHQSSPHYAVRFSPSSLPSSPLPHSTPSPSSLVLPSDTPETPTGFPLNSPSLSNPSFARDPPDGIERCLTSEIKPISTEIMIPCGPDRTKGKKIEFQKSSAFLPASHRALAINSVS